VKNYLKRYSYAYAITSIFILVVAAMITRRFDVDLNVRALMALLVGSMIIAALIALSVTIIKQTWGNGMLNIVVGYLVIFPIPFIIRIMFGRVLFRGTLALFLIGLVYALLYSLVVLYASLKNKKVEQKLNALLEGSQKEDDSESP
jgi:phosphotransferase system  glucose/maltose/N-acetylglucosamine-specific IIC component